MERFLIFQALELGRKMYWWKWVKKIVSAYFSNFKRPKLSRVRMSPLH